MAGRISTAMTADPRIDAYIERQADFARPILDHIRAVVHAACSDAVEDVKWGMPTFLYRGKLMAGMAAFKRHAVMSLWHGGQLRGPDASAEAMGEFGRLTSIADLPDVAELTRLVHAQMAMIDDGVKAVRDKTVKPPLEVPPDLAAALAAAPAARVAWDGFPPSCRHEYLEWVLEAKRPRTRARRIAETVALTGEGKKRHWRYENC